MDAERWREISDLAALAAETDPGQRETLLSAHPELREEVESLLRYMEEGSGPLDRLPVSTGSASPYLNRRIGAYRVVRELGRGGMGVVLLVQRDNRRQSSWRVSRFNRSTSATAFWKNGGFWRAWNILISPDCSMEDLRKMAPLIS